MKFGKSEKEEKNRCSHAFIDDKYVHQCVKIINHDGKHLCNNHYEYDEKKKKNEIKIFEW